MIDRILDFSDGPAKLSVRLEQLVIERPEQTTATVPLRDIAVVCASHPQVRYSQAVLAGLADAGAILVACDRRQSPVAMLLPLEGHSTQAERFRRQVALTIPARKRLWKQLVQSKVRAQGRTLERLHGVDAGLRAMAERVRSGDPDNLEAQAAQRYWPLLFADREFRRRRDAEDHNQALNYGYAVLRAMTARAVCAAGLHPTFGLHHSNRYNAFALADDLMEPFRPIVDETVAEILREWGPITQVDRRTKADILDGLLERFVANGESRALFVWLTRLGASLAAVVMGDRGDLAVPELGRAAPQPPRREPARERMSGSGLERTG